MEYFISRLLRFGANGGDACGCRNPLGGVVLDTFFALGLFVKILDRHSLDGGGALCRYPLEGIVVQLRFSSVSSVASLCYSCIFHLSLICYVRESPHHLVWVQPVMALFIKRDKSLFRGACFAGHMMYLQVSSLKFC
jgi:hypothetical protein